MNFLNDLYFIFIFLAGIERIRQLENICWGLTKKISWQSPNLTSFQTLWSKQASLTLTQYNLTLNKHKNKQEKKTEIKNEGRGGGAVVCYLFFMSSIRDSTKKSKIKFSSTPDIVGALQHKQTHVKILDHTTS